MSGQVRIEDTIVELMRSAVTTLPDDVLMSLRNARDSEDVEIARTQLDTILKNIEHGNERSIPMCQDTGLHIFFVSGRYSKEIEEAIVHGVMRATKEIPLRPNAVHPLTRKNAGTNVAGGLPHIIYEPSDQEFTDITVLIKGAGSENMSSLSMLTPAQGIEGVKRAVIDTVVRAGGMPCPPTIVGVGIGGTADMAALLAKKALLVPLDQKNDDPMLEALEEELKATLNKVGIGPMGLGGRTTVLGVRIAMAYCHTASLPVAVNLQCWAARKATARVYADGTSELIRGASE